MGDIEENMLPCPVAFCNGEVIDLVVDETGGVYRGQCLECGLSAPGVRREEKTMAWAVDKATRNWNQVVEAIDQYKEGIMAA